jgi:outer membrane protein TolC
VLAAAAAQGVARQKDLLFHPQFFTQLQYVDDTRDTQSPPIYGTSISRRNVAVGVREQTPYGLGVQLAFDYDQSILYNTDPNFITHPNLMNTYVVPQFNLSLWQNFLGRADRASEQAMEARERATALGKGYEAKAMLVRAEGGYWKLAVAREVVRVQSESVQRARDILEFDSRKAQRHLIDATDLLVAQAAVKGKDLELRAMEDEARTAAWAFNSARAIDNGEVPETLDLPDPDTLRNLELPQRGERRGDVRAAEQAVVAEGAGSEIARQKLLPELSLYGSIYAVGLNFTLPLDVWATGAARDGYAQREAAALLSLRRTELDEEAEWNDLVRRFRDARERFGVALELEQVQKAKFENVRHRQAHGLTVEDQVFQYELDYLNASLARVQIEGLILGLRAQTKLFAEAR